MLSDFFYVHNSSLEAKNVVYDCAKKNINESANSTNIHLTEQKKKNQGSKKKQKVIHVKEIKFRPLIEDGDYIVKLGKIINFLEQGDKVKVSLRFRGREMRHTELGENLLNRVCGDIKDISLIEQEAELEGRQLIMVVAPRSN